MFHEDVSVGFIGFGEAAYEIAKGLRAAGIKEILVCHKRTADLQRAALVKQRAEEVGAKYCGSVREVVQGSHLVFSLVPPAAAVEVAQDASAYIGHDQVFLDLTSSEPSEKQHCAKLVEAGGALYIDGAIMGSVPILKHKVLIYISGKNSQGIERLLTKYGMNVVMVGNAPGFASGAKMLTSIVTKGLEALFVETLLAAHACGLEDNVLRAVEQFFQMGLNKMVDRFVGSDAVYAKRRVSEMEGAARFLSSLGVEPIMARATVKRLEWSASLNLDQYFQGVSPSSYRQVIEAWEKMGLFAKGRAGLQEAQLI
ncbi:MAG: DUF1932 domain-containing protein [Bacillota bacterium]